MIISLIAAMSENRVIGKGNSLPWDAPEDRRKFRDVTMGHPVVMGRKTFESIGRPLPGRTTVVVTRDRGYRADGCTVYHDLFTAFTEEGKKTDEIFVSGGGEIFEEALPIADRIYLTVIHRTCDGDTFFPILPAGTFEKVSEEPLPGSLPATFIILERCRTRIQEA
jgi:dihydrofolate reductase